MGPFNGSNTEYVRKRGVFTGRLIVEQSSKKIFEVVLNCGVLSRHQIVLLANSKTISKTVGSLTSKGYLDEYISKSSPPLYSLGKKGAEILNVPHRTWNTTSLLRLVASNQLWIQAKKIWPNSKWDTVGKFPVLTIGETSFVVIAPRLRPRENFYTILACNQRENKRLLIVAATQNQAEELAQSIPDNVRFTWDGLLKNDIVFYRSVNKKLLKDEIPKNIIPKTIDRDTVSGL